MVLPVYRLTDDGVICVVSALSVDGSISVPTQQYTVTRVASHLSVMLPVDDLIRAAIHVLMISV
jgi:hypothetical protein